MVRQTYRTNPAQKHLEVFQNFSGGMNSISDRAVLADHEFSDLINMDINPRGTISRRKGFSTHIESVGEGKAQGYFRLYLEDGVIHEIIAQGGKLYKDGKELVIEELEEGFQTERMIEAVQFRKSLYIATGTKLVEYDGETAKVLEPYTPDPLEALYVGTNGLAEFPDQYMKDGEATFLRLDGLTFSSRYGTINEPVTLTGYVSKPAGTTTEFKFQKKLDTDVLGDWDTFQDWSEERSAEFLSDEVGNYQFRVYARTKGQAGQDPLEYLVPKYVVKPAPDEEDEEVPVDDIQLCNRIMLYWDRLIMYGNPTQSDAIYISHLNSPAYFPVPNSLRFENVEQEGITTLFRYRDMLLAFTPSSIQSLQGKSPLDFVRHIFQTNIGCISPFGVATVDNHVAFLSNDGVYILKSVGYSENRANVEKIDTNVSNLVTKDENISLVSIDNQLHVMMPNENKRLRYYYTLGSIWTKDESPLLDFANMYNFNGELICLGADGNVIVPDDTYNDAGHVYDDVFETKDFTFWQPNHIKKLKEFQMSLVGIGDVYLDAYADDSIVFSSTEDFADVDETGQVVWEKSVTAFGRWELGKSSLGIPDRMGKVNISGKCRRTRIRMTHTGEEANELIGFAYVFKLKKG